jgi:hypothetical protein
MTDLTIIPLHDHPHNLDPTATLVSTRRDEPGIFRVQTGYVACLRDLLCLAGTFPTQQAARQAQATQVRGP